MNAHSPEIRPAVAADWPAIRRLLDDSGLPLAGLDASAVAHFLVADLGAELAGCIGLECAPPLGLVRSLAVAPVARGRGLGARLVAAVESRARGQGLDALYLMTPSAAPFFARLGFHAVAGLPGPLSGHPQTHGPCADARAMGKSVSQEIAMTTLEVFDPALCCPTGVCGVDTDPELVRFASDLAWVAEQGVTVNRHNLAQDPAAFAANPLVVREMEAGMARLPVLLIDGELASTGLYPTREQLARRLGLVKPRITIGQGGSTCTPGSGCC